MSCRAHVGQPYSKPAGPRHDSRAGRPAYKEAIVEAAIFGFVGVLIGTISTAALTVYKERVTGRREVEQRRQQDERERRNTRDVFQRDSILSLQSAVTAMIGAAYDELDRQVALSTETGIWPVRQWETPTAKGWSTALLQLEADRARVFNDELRSLADALRRTAGDSIWADSLETAKQHSRSLEPLNTRFNDAISRTLPSLYGVSG
jgi:hypothetical protein